MVSWNGTCYAYVKNLQGDIVGIVDANGNEVVRYFYDAWGKPISKTGTMAATLGTLNPFRYRGYVWDEETGLYYLRSRYYGTSWDRFINADTLVKNNIFEYCDDSPCNKSDMSGQEAVVLTRNKKDSSVRYTDTILPYDTFVELIIQAVTTEGWHYVYGYSTWKKTDCVGLPKYVLNWYYSYKSFKSFSKITKGKNRDKIYNQVKDLAIYGMQYGETWEIENPDDIPIGAAVFIYNPEHPRADEKNKGWIHVGVYIGAWGDYEHAVAQAADKTNGVGIWELTDDFTRYGLFSGVDYR